MAVTCSPLLPNNDRHLCLFGVTLNVVHSVRPVGLDKCSKQTLFSPSEREEAEVVHCSAQLSAYTGRPIPPLVVEIPFLKHVNI
jgi:hypothetical protein